MINLISISGRAGSGKDTVGKIIQYFTWLSKRDIQKKDLNEFQSCEYWLEKNTVQGWGDISGIGWGCSEYQIKKFAYAVKQICSILTGIPVKDFEKEEVKSSYLGVEWQIKDKNKVSVDTGKIGGYCYTVRELLQKVSTDAMRDVIHPDVWVNALMKDYKLADDLLESLEGIPYNYDHEKSLLPNWIITDVRFPNEAKAIKDRQGIVIRINRNPKNKWIDKAEWDFHTKGIEPHVSETALDDYTFDYVIENDSDIPSLIEKVREMLIYFKIINNGRIS
ncbi:MAG: hypothetical protein M0R17_04745 [Candidatus Omnitrophica bacterium]|jgi:hypothetical protein|nr:hypothetical protein [Candidatus Omnitrophota bacterium]